MLRQAGVATQLAKRVHVFTMPFIPKFIKRPPEYQAGDHDLIAADLIER